ASLVEGTEARFVVPMRRPVALRGTLWLAPASEDARVELRLGGVQVLDVTLTEGWQQVPLELPAAALAAGFNYIEVRQSFAPEPATPREIGATGVVTPLELLLESDARIQGGLARFTVGRAQWEVRTPGVSMQALPPTIAPTVWKTGDERD